MEYSDKVVKATNTRSTDYATPMDGKPHSHVDEGKTQKTTKPVTKIMRDTDVDICPKIEEKTTVTPKIAHDFETLANTHDPGPTHKTDP